LAVARRAVFAIAVECRAELLASHLLDTFHIAVPGLRPAHVFDEAPGQAKWEVGSGDPWPGLRECFLDGREALPVDKPVCDQVRPVEPARKTRDWFLSAGATGEVDTKDFCCATVPPF
jgi:hypothetical protein